MSYCTDEFRLLYRSLVLVRDHTIHEVCFTVSLVRLATHIPYNLYLLHVRMKCSMYVWWALRNFFPFADNFCWALTLYFYEARSTRTVHEDRNEEVTCRCGKWTFEKQSTNAFFIPATDLQTTRRNLRILPTKISVGYNSYFQFSNLDTIKFLLILSWCCIVNDSRMIVCF